MVSLIPWKLATEGRPSPVEIEGLSLEFTLCQDVGSALLHRFGYPTNALSLKTQLSGDFPTAYRHIPNTVESLSK